MIHVHPVNDSMAHTLVGTGCACGPKLDFSKHGEMAMIHNAADGREGREEEGLVNDAKGWIADQEPE